MSKIIYIIFFLLLWTNSQSQSLNAILFVNEKVIDEEIANLNLIIEDKFEQIKIPFIYYPGELVFGDVTWNKLFKNKEKRIAISFDYYTYSRKGKQSISNYIVQLKPVHFNQPYLLIKIYDFKKRKYKKWYGHLTNQEYITEIEFPNSGLYIRK